MSLERIFAPLLLAESLEARLADQLEALDNILADFPAKHQPVRLSVIASIQQLRTAVHQLQFQRLVCYLASHNQLHAHMRDIDDSSDFQP